MQGHPDVACWYIDRLHIQKVAPSLVLSSLTDCSVPTCQVEFRKYESYLTLASDNDEHDAVLGDYILMGMSPKCQCRRHLESKIHRPLGVTADMGDPSRCYVIEDSGVCPVIRFSGSRHAPPLAHIELLADLFSPRMATGIGKTRAEYIIYAPT